jgi:uncharacterized protein involved in exopolysaccharide biosynthesis
MKKWALLFFVIGVGIGVAWLLSQKPKGSGSGSGSSGSSLGQIPIGSSGSIGREME